MSTTCNYAICFKICEGKHHKSNAPGNTVKILESKTSVQSSQLVLRAVYITHRSTCVDSPQICSKVYSKQFWSSQCKHEHMGNITGFLWILNGFLIVANYVGENHKQNKVK